MIVLHLPSFKTAYFAIFPPLYHSFIFMKIGFLDTICDLLTVCIYKGRFPIAFQVFSNETQECCFFLPNVLLNDLRKATKFPQFWLNAFNFDSQLLSNEGVNEESRSTNFFSIAKSCLMSREASSLENEFEKHFCSWHF